MDLQNDEKRIEESLRLFQSQKQTMDAFLERGAISRAQYDKSLKALREKMGIDKILSQEKQEKQVGQTGRTNKQDERETDS